MAFRWGRLLRAEAELAYEVDCETDEIFQAKTPVPASSIQMMLMSGYDGYDVNVICFGIMALNVFLWRAEAWG